MKKKRPEESGGNWMDTYGDMVTLLLTFFVMLYSMSNLDAKKWEIFVRSIGPDNAEKTVEQVGINSQVGETEDPFELSTQLPEIEQVTDEEILYLTLLEKLSELGVEGVSVERGEDYTFVTFQDSPFFDGESSVLTEQGKEVLDVFCQVITGMNQVIGQINIMGHTSQADPEVANDSRRDRMLSSMRAAEVCIYIQDKEVIEPEKLVCLSYGQHRPVASFDTAEDRAQNRRVEILLLDNGAEVSMMNDFYNEYSEEIYTEQSGNVSDTTSSEEGFNEKDVSKEDVATGMSPITPPNSAEPLAEINAEK